MPISPKLSPEEIRAEVKRVCLERKIAIEREQHIGLERARRARATSRRRAVRRKAP